MRWLHGVIRWKKYWRSHEYQAFLMDIVMCWSVSKLQFLLVWNRNVFLFLFQVERLQQLNEELTIQLHMHELQKAALSDQYRMELATKEVFDRFAGTQSCLAVLHWTLTLQGPGNVVACIHHHASILSAGCYKIYRTLRFVLIIDPVYCNIVVDQVLLAQSVRCTTSSQATRVRFPVSWH